MRQVGFELSSNMHMNNALDSHIYSVSSNTSYVSLVWQMYVLFLFYANNL